MIETYYLLYSDWLKPLFGIFLALILITVFAIIIKDRLSNPSQSNYSNTVDYTVSLDSNSQGALPKEEKLCSNCKTEILDSTKFCPKCGKKQ